MELYKKPVMKIIELEEVDVLTASCPTCHSLNYLGNGHYPIDGCKEDCTASGHE